MVPSKMHGRVRIGLPKMYEWVRISLPKMPGHSVLTFLKCMDGSVWSHLRYPTQSAPTRYPQMEFGGSMAIMQEKQQNHLFEIE